MYGDSENKFEKMPGNGENKESRGAYADTWEAASFPDFEDRERIDPADAMPVGMSPEDQPTPETLPPNPEQEEGDPSKRTFELGPEEIAPSGEIADDSFDVWRERARQIFTETPGVTNVILINSITKEVVADFTPDNIDTITRATATENPQETNLLDNLSDGDAVTGNKELSADKGLIDALTDEEGDTPDSLRVNDIVAASNKNMPLGSASNPILDAVAATAGVTAGADSIDAVEVAKKLAHDGHSAEDIAAAAKDLKNSVGREDIDAGGVVGFDSDTDNLEKQKTVAANAAVIGMAGAVESVAQEASGNHEAAIEAADEAADAARDAISATKEIPALEGGDNDGIFGSTDMRTRQTTQLAEGALASAQDAKKAASEALAAEEEAEAVQQLMDTPAAPANPVAEVYPDAEGPVDPNTGIPLYAPEHSSDNLQVDLNSANPQDAYFEMLSKKMEDEHAAEAAAAQQAAEIAAYAQGATNKDIKKHVDQYGDDPDAPHMATPIMS